MSAELKIREALDDLATGPVPEDLAERALRGAAHRRTARLSTAAAGVTALGLVAAGFAVWAPPGPSTTHPGDATAACVFFGSSDPVPQQEWPGLLRAVVGALPDRYEYSMEYGYAWCTRDDPGAAWDDPYGSFPSAMARLTVDGWADIVLTVDVHLAAPGPLAGCDSLSTTFLRVSVPPGIVPEVCVEPVGDGPLVLGGSGKRTDGGQLGLVWRTAVYPDGTIVALTARPDLFTGEELAAAAVDPDVYASIPLAGSPGVPGD